MDERYEAIMRAVAVSYPEAVTAPYLMLAATDSRWYHRWTDGVYRFAPLAMNAAQRASIHGLDEWVTTDSLERGERFHRALITGGSPSDDRPRSDDERRAIGRRASDCGNGGARH